MNALSFYTEFSEIFNQMNTDLSKYYCDVMILRITNIILFGRNLFITYKYFGKVDWVSSNYEFIYNNLFNYTNNHSIKRD